MAMIVLKRILLISKSEKYSEKKDEDFCKLTLVFRKYSIN